MNEEAASTEPVEPPVLGGGARSRLLGGYAAITVLAATGTALLVLPFVSAPRNPLVPGAVEGRGAVYARLAGVVGELDAACVAGDLARVGELTTDRFREQLRGEFERAGRRYSSQHLQAQGALVGELGKQTFLGGRATADRAVVVHSVASSAERFLDAERRGAGVHALRFVWDQSVGRLRVDLRAFRQIRRDESEADVVATWIGELLGPAD